MVENTFDSRLFLQSEAKRGRAKELWVEKEVPCESNHIETSRCKLSLKRLVLIITMGLKIVEMLVLWCNSGDDALVATGWRFEALIVDAHDTN